MKKCKYCQTEIDKKAKYCPNCQKKQGTPKWLSILLIILGIIIISSAFSGTEEENAQEGNGLNNNTSNATEETPEENNSNNSNSSTTNQKKEKFTYEITSQYSDDYGSAYYIEGVVRNNKDKDYSYVQIEFVCYDSEGNNLGTAIDNTNNLLGNETWKFKAIAMFSNAENVDHCEYHDITSW